MSNATFTPRIILAGDQNAGKTSVVERLCALNIGIPSYGVVEWHLSPGPMSAEVSIVWISPLDESSLRIPFGQLVYNAGSLESLLRRAQIAVVLHKDEASRVFDYTDSEIFDLHISLANIKTYTSHIIHVHYRHPDIPWKATIVDLPGIVTNGPAALVKASQEITLANIRPTTNVIVVVMPLLFSDRWNTTWNVVRQEDPNYCRTIGLVTQPAGIPNASEIWRRISKGDFMPECPAFCVHSPREYRTGVSFSDSRNIEKAFFSNSMPWAMENRNLLGMDAFLAGAKQVSQEIHYGLPPVIQYKIDKTLLRLEMVQKPNEASLRLARAQKPKGVPVKK